MLNIDSMITRSMVDTSGHGLIHGNGKYIFNTRGVRFHRNGVLVTDWRNGLNLTKSIGNPDSLFEKIRKVLREKGPMDRKSIFRSIGKVETSHSNLFTYLRRRGFIKGVRNGRWMLYTLTPEGDTL